MKELLNWGLLFAGFGLSLLVIASFWIPRILGWKEKLKGLSPLMKELWWTYAFYVWATNTFMAILALGFRDWLLSGTPAAAAVAGFICFWWTLRVYLQFFGFDLKEVEDTHSNRIAKNLCRGLIKTGLYFFVQNWNSCLIFIFPLLAAWLHGWLAIPV